MALLDRSQGMSKCEHRKRPKSKMAVLTLRIQYPKYLPGFHQNIRKIKYKYGNNQFRICKDPTILPFSGDIF